MKYFITGSNGLLGQTIYKNLQKKFFVQKENIYAVSRGSNRISYIPDNQFISWDLTRKEIDWPHLPDRDSVLIHCAAMTNVDECEKKQHLAYQCNVEASRNLAAFANQQNCKFIFLSTDFVFDGSKGIYEENDPPNPVNYYGKTKMWAEQSVLEEKPDTIIVRTIVVYGHGIGLSKKNIVEFILEKLLNNQPVTLVQDQYRMPTYVEDLADAVIKLSQSGLKGIFHVSGGEQMSIADMGRKIAGYLNKPIDLISPVDSNYFANMAPRPPKTGFSLKKISNSIHYSPTPFIQSIDSIYKQIIK